MADLLAFVLVAGLVVGGPLIWLLWRSRPKPGATNMVLIWHARNEAEREIALGSLRSAGVHHHVVDSGAYYRPEVGSLGSLGGSQYEIWVPARDEDRAREALGL
jgi:hypothetical protein